MANSWYAYITGNPTLASSYLLVPVMPTCTPVGFCICAIFTPSGGNTPDTPFSPALQMSIANALAMGIPQPNVLVKLC